MRRASKVALLIRRWTSIPMLRLPDREALLRHTPTGALILGLAVGPYGELIAASVWNTDNATEQRVHVTEGPTGARVRHLLAELHQPEAADQTTARGASARRRGLWDDLQRALGPALQHVLGPALDGGPVGIAVLAPGCLRSLPLLGLQIGDRPLHERSLGVMLLPSLGVERAHHGATGEACLLGRERDEGDTSFGEAAVETLRRWFEPRVIRPPREVTTTIVEVDQLEPIAPTLRALRLYGVGNVETLAPTLASMNIEGRRKLTDKNTRGLLLWRCEVVELWAATAGSGPVNAILRDDRDHIPGLVRSFLLCGAAGVIDLAWPANDLVKALVCERFGVLHRARGMRGPEALGRAVAETAELLRAWRSAVAGAASLGEALGWLDQARLAAAREARLCEAGLLPFAACAGAQRRRSLGGRGHRGGLRPRPPRGIPLLGLVPGMKGMRDEANDYELIEDFSAAARRQLVEARGDEIRLLLDSAFSDFVDAQPGVSLAAFGFRGDDPIAEAVSWAMDWFASTDLDMYRIHGRSRSFRIFTEVRFWLAQKAGRKGYSSLVGAPRLVQPDPEDTRTEAGAEANATSAFGDELAGTLPGFRDRTCADLVGFWLAGTKRLRRDWFGWRARAKPPTLPSISRRGSAASTRTTPCSASSAASTRSRSPRRWSARSWHFSSPVSPAARTSLRIASRSAELVRGGAGLGRARDVARLRREGARHLLHRCLALAGTEGAVAMRDRLAAVFTRSSLLDDAARARPGG